jgi:hypothetical protein
MCLYESNKKLLVAGDHILNDIIPYITLCSNDRNSLKEKGMVRGKCWERG